MGNNENTDNRNQGTTGNDSQSTNREGGKKVTDPNNPVAGKDKQSGSGTGTDKKSMTTQGKSNLGSQSGEERDEDTDERDENSGSNNSGSNKKDGSDSNQNSRK